MSGAMGSTWAPDRGTPMQTVAAAVARMVDGFDKGEQ